jgi:hypothetical protein
MIFPPRWSELASPFSPLYDILKLAVSVFAVGVLPWLVAMGLVGCGSVPISTSYLDSVAAERAREVCIYARVPVEHLPYCIERGVNARQSSQIFGAWSPI